MMFRQSDARNAAVIWMTCSMFIAFVFGDDAPKTDLKPNAEQQAVLDADPVIKKAESRFDSEFRDAEAAFLAAKQRAAGKRLLTYREQLKAFTRAGEFDKAVACKAAIQKLEASELEGSQPRPNDLIKFDGHNYALIKEPATWHVAKRKCEMMGGHLGCLESPREVEFAINLMKKNNDHYWIGATKEEGSWKWITGKPVVLSIETFDNVHGTEHHIEWNPDHNRWNDGPAGWKFNYLCEWDN